MTDLEHYIPTTGEVDAIELRKELDLSEADLRIAVEYARRRGCPVIFVNNKLYRAKTKKEFERALLAEWDHNKKTNTIEYR